MTGLPAPGNGSGMVETRDPRMLDCILVRHGESEGNIAYNRSWSGDHSLYTGAFLKRHSSLWRLTDRGQEQARTAGKWLMDNAFNVPPPPSVDPAQVDNRIHRYYVSEYIRAMETAALMQIPDAKWFVEVQLRERDWGTFDIMSQKERVVRFSEETRRRDRDSLFYAPPGGESLVHVLSRVDGVLTNFNRQCSNRRCIVVCHGEVMWAFRLRFERLSQLTYREMEAAHSPYERIHNAQIIWYSRRNPYTGEISKFFKWKRSVCPWDLSRSHNDWQEIIRVEHTNESLLQHVHRVKRIYANEKSKRATELEKQQEDELKRMAAATVRPAPPSEAQVAQQRYAPPPPNASTEPAPEPASESDTDPGVAEELRTLKVDDPVMAARAANIEARAADLAHLPPPRPKTAAAASHTHIPARLEATATPDTQPSPAASSSTPVPPSSIHSSTSTTSSNPSPVPSPSDESVPEDAHMPVSGSPLSVTISSTPSTASSAAAAQLDALSHLTAPSTTPVPAVWSPPAGWPFLSAHPRVLVLTKTPRYEHEKNALGLKGQHLHAELSRLGFMSDRLVQSYVRHMEGLAQLTLALQQHGMKVIVKHVDTATPADIDGIDLILSAGGDGTMLKSASLLGFQHLRKAKQQQQTHSSSSHTSTDTNHHANSNESGTKQTSTDLPSALSQPARPHSPSSASTASVTTDNAASPNSPTPAPYIPIPLIGVNTDPQHSSGVLCAFSIEGPHTAERVIEHLKKSHFVWLNKSRIEITLIDKSGSVRTIEQYAYNDVVVAERDPGRPMVYELTVDEQPAEIQRSSGVLVCTGTGSTAWMANAAGIHADQVQAVLKDINYKHTLADARAIAERINMDLIFESNSPEVEFYVREPLLPLSSSAAALGRSGYAHRHGWAGRVCVRSLGWDAVISMDGLTLVPLPKGTTAIIQIGKKPGANLTVLALAGTGEEPFSRQ